MTAVPRPVVRGRPGFCFFFPAMRFPTVTRDITRILSLQYLRGVH
jgi:hypothetical protein